MMSWEVGRGFRGDDNGGFMTRVLLIDDDEKLLALLNDYLVEEGFSVRVENDAAGGVVAALSGEYAIVVLDVMMPRLSGLDALRRIRQQSTLPILMLTARGDDVDRITGLELGADDYVAKPCTPRELVARIRAILRRTQTAGPFDPSAGALVSGGLTMWPEQRRAEWLGGPLQLTSTEFSLLEVLLRHVGYPVSKGDLSMRALGRPHARHDRSIDVHLSSIRRKLGTQSDGRSLIQAVHRRGYQLLKE
ncbi:MAG TPA: response regulator transcription factor [Steroidobacteraceae bacterium]|nr:response regulator transcription factor [Steroidobacteraceae bacterium]